MKKKSNGNGSKAEIPQDVLMDYVKKNMGTAPKVVRHAGQLNWVEVNGERVERQDEIRIGDYGMVKCAETDNHFVYRYMKRKGWTTFCTCGSPAVIVGYDAYRQMASPQGMLLVCYSMLLSGKHSDGSS